MCKAVGLGWMVVCSVALAGQDPKSEEERTRGKADPNLAGLKELMATPVILASKTSMPQKDAPGTVTSISKDELSAFGWNSLNEMLWAQPGFSESQDYDRKTTSSRGLYEGWKMNHLMLLVDGMPFNDNLNGEALTTEITPLFMAKSIEVMRGPGSALYGSNATNGVISINTIEAADIAPPGEARVWIGSQNTRQYDLLLGHTGDQFSMVTAYTRFQTGGHGYWDYDTSGEVDAAGNLIKHRLRDDRATDYFFVKLSGEGDLEGLSLQYHRQAWQFQTGHGWNFVIPDAKETQDESRDIFTLKWETQRPLGWSREFAFRYYVHHFDWNPIFAHPNTPSDPTHPIGIHESLQGHFDDYFGRAQFTYRAKNNATLLGGIEVSQWVTHSDESHYSDVNMNQADGDWNYFPDRGLHPLRDSLALSVGHPIHLIGIFSQYQSPALFSQSLTLHLGLRYDTRYNDYTAIDLPGSPVKSARYSEVSPRFATIYRPSDSLAVKLLVGRGFRAPSPSEQYGANSWNFSFNPGYEKVRPEVTDSVEGVLDFAISDQLNWRLNLYHTTYKNQIAFKPTAGLTDNLYTLATEGIENEFQFRRGASSGFMNVSYARRTSETILDPAIALSEGRLTWVPSLTSNLGLRWQSSMVDASVSLRYQGSVRRRPSDYTVATYNAYRPDHVASWTSLNMRLGWNLGKHLQAELGGTNLGDARGMLVKKFQYPFDYQIDPRVVYVALRLR